MQTYRLIFQISMAFNLIFGTITFVHAQNYSPYTYIHPRAAMLMPLFVSEVDRLAPYIEHYEYIPALVEQESCITLKHSRCFSPQSELKNSREQGVGLFQHTRAWTTSGQLRFDTLSALRNQYKSELRDLGWDNIKDRPDLQIRAGILLIRSSYPRYRDIQDTYERLKFLDSAFNGGDRDVSRARAACKLTKSCNPNIWFNHVENHNPKSRIPHKAYGGRSLKDINNEHVSNVFKIRIAKYKTYIEKNNLVKRPLTPIGEADAGKGR